MKLIRTFLFLLVVSCLFVGQALAQGGVSVSPLISEVQLVPSGVFDHEIVVKNTSDQIFEIEVEVFDIDIDSNRDVTFLPESSKGNQQRSFASWVKFPSSQRFSLNPGESRIYPVEVLVPDSVLAGDYYASVNFYFTSRSQASKIRNSNSIGVRQSVGSLLLATIAGDTNGLLSTSEVVFGDMSVSEELEMLTVMVDAQNDSLKYVHVSPVITISDSSGEVYFRSQGEAKRIFPGGVDTIAHSFPREYLHANKALNMKFEIQNKRNQAVFFSESLSLSSLGGGIADSWVSMMDIIKNISLVVFLTAVVGLIYTLSSRGYFGVRKNKKRRK